MAIINRLRFVDILSPHIGDRSSRNFTEALQDEMKDVVLAPEQEQLLARLMAQMDARFARMETRIWQIVGVASAVYLSALGIATGAIIALN